MPTQADKGRPTVPAKCSACNRPMPSPIFCENCRSLYPAEGLNYFALFGLEPTFDIDPAALRQEYLRLSRGVHPDRHVEQTDSDTSLHLSAQINEAQRVLADPVLRAEYLLELSGGSAATSDRSVLDGVLSDALLIREELAEVRAAGDAVALERCRAEIRARHDRIQGTIAELARQLPADEASRSRLRAALNSIKYYQKLLADA